VLRRLRLRARSSVPKWGPKASSRAIAATGLPFSLGDFPGKEGCYTRIAARHSVRLCL